MDLNNKTAEELANLVANHEADRETRVQALAHRNLPVDVVTRTFLDKSLDFGFRTVAFMHESLPVEAIIHVAEDPQDDVKLRLLAFGKLDLPPEQKRQIAEKIATNPAEGWADLRRQYKNNDKLASELVSGSSGPITEHVLNLFARKSLLEQVVENIGCPAEDAREVYHSLNTALILGSARTMRKTLADAIKEAEAEKQGE